ncbi:hypothetical protein, partial [Hallella sp.]|uniref:hypothetical protein n=1 Tax=Hallella sp. TaxID=2980186 RepID=UPI00307A8D62
ASLALGYGGHWAFSPLGLSGLCATIVFSARLGCQGPCGTIIFLPRMPQVFTDAARPFTFCFTLIFFDAPLAGIGDLRRRRYG